MADAHEATGSTAGGPGAAKVSGAMLQWTIWICLAAGALGILSGFCIFLLVQEKSEEGSGRVFLGVLTVAALAAFVTEYFRDIIKHGHLESLNVARVLVTVVTLMMFELIILAWEAIPEMRGAAWRKVPSLLLGPALEGTGHVWLNVVVMAALWVGAGMTLACTLGLTALTGEELPMKRQIAIGAGRGITAGIVVAPVGTVLFVLLARVVLAARAFIFEHAAWKQHLRELARVPRVGDTPAGYMPFRFVFGAFVWIDDLFSHGWWGPVVGVIVLMVIGAFVFNSKPNYVSVLLIGAVAAVIFGPILADLGTLLLIPVFAALVWCVPGALLGMATPLLRRPSDQPREWGFIALGAALILIVVTWSRFPYWYVLPTGLLLMSAAYFRRGVPIEDYWPVVALSVGIIVCGVVWVAQRATFAGVLGRVHKLNSLPVFLPEPKRPEPVFPMPGWKPWTGGLGGLGNPAMPGLGGAQPKPMSEEEVKGMVEKYVVESPEKAREEERRLEEEREAAARRLELSLSGSLGFWVTVGILATWALKRHGGKSEGMG